MHAEPVARAWHLPTPGGSRPHLAGIQRARLLSAALHVVEEFGCANASVIHITERAHVSRRTFYELFASRDACIAAAIEDVIGLIEREVVAQRLGGLAWREQVRGGLFAILCFFEREPLLARVCVVQSLGGDQEILVRRQALVERLTAIVDEGRLQSERAAQCKPLIAEGLVGAVLSILHARLLREEPERLSGMLGELMGMIVLPYLGAAAMRREQTRLAPEPIRVPEDGASEGELLTSDPLSGVQLRLTYRTARVLESVAANPGASNRRVGGPAGIADPGQISKLLSRLQRLGLLVNTSPGKSKGEPNAWWLTPRGERVARHLSLDHTIAREVA
jgi:AcrR family transcriptional regulator